MGNSWFLHDLAVVSSVQGDHKQAKRLFEESLVLNWELVIKLTIVDCLAGLVCLAVERREALRAARLWAVAEALREATGYPQDPVSHAEVEPYPTSARSRPGEAAWEEALA